MGVSGRVWPSLGVSGCVWQCLGVSRRVHIENQRNTLLKLIFGGLEAGGVGRVGHVVESIELSTKMKNRFCEMYKFLKF